MAVNGTLPPALRMIVKIHYPLPVKHRPPVSPSSDIPPSPLPLPSTEPESLGDDQIEREHSLKARTDDTMTGKNGKIEVKCKCSALKLSIQRAGTRVEAPRQLFFSNREMQ